MPGCHPVHPSILLSVHPFIPHPFLLLFPVSPDRCDGYDEDRSRDGGGKGSWRAFHAVEEEGQSDGNAGGDDDRERHRQCLPADRRCEELAKLHDGPAKEESIAPLFDRCGNGSWKVPCLEIVYPEDDYSHDQRSPDGGPVIDVPAAEPGDLFKEGPGVFVLDLVGTFRLFHEQDCDKVLLIQRVKNTSFSLRPDHRAGFRQPGLTVSRALLSVKHLLFLEQEL